MADELFDAIERHDRRQVEALLARGADPNEPLTKSPGWRPLEAAIEEAYHGGPPDVLSAIVQALIQRGADVNAWDQERRFTPLLAAVAWSFFPAVQMLLEAGADPNAINARRESPLILAVGQNDLPTAELLLRRGAGNTIDVLGTEVGLTPLAQATLDVNLPMMTLLLDAGADPDVLDGDGRSVRDYLPPRDKSDPDTWDAALELLALRSRGQQ